MAWIKRNLYFLVGSVVGVGLLAVAVVYMLGGSARDSAVKETLSASYAKLKDLKNLDPSPGSVKVDNITNAQAQVAALQKYSKEAQATFVPIAPIPNTPRVDVQLFSSELTATLNALRAMAGEKPHTVLLPSTNPPYNFTFESIVRQVTFKQPSLQALARQLGEVKAISEILFRAKITALDGFKRVRVAVEDNPTANPADYLNESPKTNDWAVLVPYEVSIRCLSTELAAVLNGFANSKHPLLVHAINVEPAPQADSMGFADPSLGFPPMGLPQPYMGVSPGVPRFGGMDPMAARMRSRYGGGIGGPGMRGEGRGQPPPRATPQPIYQPPPPGGGPPPPPSAQVVLFERPVRVTLKITLVQLLGTNVGGKPRGRTAD